MNENIAPHEMYQISLIDYNVQETKLYQLKSEMVCLGNPDIDDFDEFVNCYHNH